MCSICLFGCQNSSNVNVINVEDVVINKSHAYCDVGEKIVLLAQVFPFNANNQKIVWKSDNPFVAKVSNGVVEGVDAGRTIITALSEDGNISDSCVLYVSNPKLDYNKYPNKNLSNSFKNISIEENYQKNSDFQSIFENIFENLNNLQNELNNYFKNYISDFENKTDFSSESNKNLEQNVEENQNDKDNQDVDNNSKIYFYEYKYNSDGIDDEVDDFTIYKDDNTIIKEVVPQGATSTLNKEN